MTRAKPAGGGRRRRSALLRRGGDGGPRHVVASPRLLLEPRVLAGSLRLPARGRRFRAGWRGGEGGAGNSGRLAVIGMAGALRVVARRAGAARGHSALVLVRFLPGLALSPGHGTESRVRC